MTEEQVAAVRRFNRSVTQRAGALLEDYLDRGRPLGQDRVLWEVGPDGCDLRELRGRLDLDAAYLSRMLRSLESEGLIEVRTAEHDRRVRRLSLTAAGRRERRLLDKRSDGLARSILEPLDTTQRARMVEAMAVVERLLAASAVTVEPSDPRDPDARACIAAYYAELGTRFDAGFDPARSISADDAELTLPHGLLLLARLHGRAVGCGALKLHGTGPAELKRMWVAAEARGLGLGRRLLAELEREAGRLGARAVRLETNRNLTEAVALYRSAGYREVEAFNAEPYAHHWFEKELPGSG